MKTLPQDSSDSSKDPKMSNEKMRKTSSEVEVELGMHPGRRPVNIEKDVNSLGQKKRVSSILRSPDFKEELETIVTDLLRSDKGGGHVIAKAIANVFSPLGHSGHSGNTLHHMKTGIGCVSPINDLTGADTSLYSKGEKLLRCKLAALYRIVDLHGWSEAIYNHITVRISQEQEHFLINPFGLLYHEVSASKLLKVNMQGEVIDTGSTTLGFNLAGYVLHSAIHSARPDLHCVIHVHTSDAVAVSSMECGLLPISPEAVVVGEVSYHPYNGILIDSKEKKAIQKHLGPNNKVMILRNHGLVACGETVEEAFHYLYFTMLACNIQVKAMSCTKHEKLLHLDRSASKSVAENLAKQSVTKGCDEDELTQWGVGEMLFESLIRMLDDMGYRSGYIYHNPVLMRHKPRAKSDVELPATAVGHTPVFAEELEDARSSLKSGGKYRWINTPNQYTRIVESVDEEPVSGGSSQNGDISPRMKTKWKRSSEPGSSQGAAVCITSPNQFVPTNTDPREVIATRRSIRGQGCWEYNRPGPQSQLLYSVSSDRNLSSAQVVTSSKAIIEKGQDVEIVSSIGPPNPFNVMTDDGLKKYEKEVLSGGTQNSGDATKTEDTSGEVVTENVVGNSTLTSSNAHETTKKSDELKDQVDELNKQQVSSELAFNLNASNNVESGEKTNQSREDEVTPVKKGESADVNEGGKKSDKKKRRPLSFLKKKKN